MPFRTSVRLDCLTFRMLSARERLKEGRERLTGSVESDEETSRLHPKTLLSLGMVNRRTETLSCGKFMSRKYKLQEGKSS